MKTKVFYFALAVVVAAIASSCVKEQFEQPQDKPEVEITGQVFEAVSETPAVKSYLDNMTPTWVEGDEIYVSGSDESATCTFVEGNIFQTQENVKIAAPFHAVYPAEGSNSYNAETGKFTVTIPSEQIVPAGRNIGNGALVAVASSETTELGFKNAVGLVKVNIRRDDITKVVIKTTKYENIAGTCTVDLNPNKEAEGEDPAVKLIADEKNSVTLTHENGTFVSGEYYAAIYPRSIDGIEVTFTRKNGETEESVIVKKVANTTVKRNGGINLGDFFVYEISTADELLAWNKAVTKWTVWDVVTLTETIDCATIKSEDWTPNEFKGVFDGQGNTIDNLKIDKTGHASFFRKLQDATVKNVVFGTGCSFTATGATSGNIYASSLAGEVRGGTTLTDIVNKGAVNIAAEAVGGTTANYIGGISAYVKSDAVSKMTDCKNEGPVTVSAAPEAPLYCGGVVASADANTSSSLTLTRCENYGLVQYNGTNTNNNNLNIAGISAVVCNSEVTFSSCKNLGSIQSNAAASHSGQTNIGGIIALDGGHLLGVLENCVNGSLTAPAAGSLINNSAASKQLSIGGLIARVSKAYTITGFKNYGTVKNSGVITDWTALGGVVGCILTEAPTVTLCENHGSVVNENATGRSALGGIVGFIDKSNATVSDSDNAAEIKNAASAAGTAVGGIVGRIQAKADGVNTIKRCDNTGAVTFAVASKDDHMMNGIGGVIGVHAGDVYTSNSVRYHKSSTITIEECTNKGTVSKTTGAGSANMYLGGIAGALNGVLESGQSYTHVADVKTCTNGESGKQTGEVKNASSGSGYAVYAGGIIGLHRAGGEVNGCYNYAPVTNTSNTNGNVAVGGITAWAENGTMKDCLNAGVIKDDSNSNTGTVAGIAGYVDVRAMTMTNCDNSGKISGKFNSGNVTAVKVAGAIAYTTKTVTLDGCDMTGDLYCYRETEASHVFMGGLVAQIPDSSPKVVLKDCNVSGTIENETTSVSSRTAIGGFVGFCYSNEIMNCHFKTGSIINASTSNVYVGGLVGQIEGNNPISTDIANCSVNVAVTPGNRDYGGVLIGRLTYNLTETTTVSMQNVAVVGGSCNGVDLDDKNYAGYCYGSNTGTNNNYKPVDNVYFGPFQYN